MPDYGARQLSAFPDRLPPHPAGEGWDLAGARVISATFELLKAQLVPLLPDSLIRPVPAYAKLLVVDAPESPIGPFREASLLLGAREGVQIRNVLLDAIVDPGSACEAARSALGGARRPGNVDLEWSADAINVRISDAEGPLCALRMGALRRCDATMLKLDALLTVGETDAGPALLRYGIRVPLERVEGTLSRDWQITMPRNVAPWSSLRPAYNVTAFAAEGEARYEAPHLPSHV